MCSAATELEKSYHGPTVIQVNSSLFSKKELGKLALKTYKVGFDTSKRPVSMADQAEG